MSNADPIIFTRLADGTLVQRAEDGSYRPVQDRTDQARVDRWSDEEIEEMAASDPDHPALDDAFWAQVDAPQPKEAISIKLDRDVLDFFRSEGRGYQTRINAVLRHYMQARRKAG